MVVGVAMTCAVGDSLLGDEWGSLQEWGVTMANDSGKEAADGVSEIQWLSAWLEYSCALATQYEGQIHCAISRLNFQE